MLLGVIGTVVVHLVVRLSSSVTDVLWLNGKW